MEKENASPTKEKKEEKVSSPVQPSPPKNDCLPRTVEEIEEQIDNTLYMLEQLQQVKSRGRFIAKSEIVNLQKAYQYIKKEAEGSSAFSSFKEKLTSIETQLVALEEYIEQKKFNVSYHGSWKSIFHTPGIRRLQSICLGTFIFFIGVPLSFVLIILFLYFRLTRPFIILYILHTFTTGRPKHPMPRQMRVLRLPIWKYYRDYFPIRLVVPPATRKKFDPQYNYLFAYHPHGVHTFGAISSFGTEASHISKVLPGVCVHLQTLAINYYIPFWRQCMVGMGAGDASADCIRKTLRAGPGESVVLVVGGAAEALMSKPGSNDLLLHKRKGFVKIALQEGARLVPVYGFGENNAYDISSLAESRTVQLVLRLMKKYTGFTIPLVSGRGFFFSFGVLPHRRPIVVVVGEPLELPRIPNPTPEEIEHWQGKYIEAVKKLYHEHSGVYDLESTGLRIMK